MAGYGGGVLFLPFPESSAAHKYGNEGRIITFKLEGAAPPLPQPFVEPLVEEPPPHEGNAKTVAQGELLYNRFCARCHAFGRGLVPDLRRLSHATHAIFYDIVLHGAYQAEGMARWDDVLSPEDAQAIRSYLVDQAWQLHDTAQADKAAADKAVVDKAVVYKPAAVSQPAGGDSH
jgi:quinohemoprotein ethanol dehydrogenase